MGLYAVGQDIGSSTSAGVGSTPAAVPRLVQFTSLAEDIDGKPLTGTLGITFLLYRDEQGGAPLWMEVSPSEADNQCCVGARHVNARTKRALVQRSRRRFAAQ